jgi:hypothetical protein
MKKIIALTIAMLFIAGAAYALEIQNSGMMYVRGSQISVSPLLSGGEKSTAVDTPEELLALDLANGQDPNDAVSYGYLDMELDMTTVLKVDDMTSITLQYEIHDENYGGSWNDGASTAGTADLDDNIEIYRVNFRHEFSTGTIIRAGLLDGAGWSWDFGNNNNGFYRVHVQQKVAPGIIGYVYTKEAELGYGSTVEDSDLDDGDNHAIYGVLKFGDFAVQPLLVYQDHSMVTPTQDGDGRQIITLDVGVGGPMGPLGFEAEVAYKSYTADDEYADAEWNGEDSYTAYGLYLNLWGDLGPAKVGGIIAYASYDKDAGQGYGMGADFCPTVIGADYINIGSQGASGEGDTQYFAVTFGQLYASLAISEPLSINASFSYWQSNEEDTAWEDSTGYEIDLGCAYKISNNVTYSIAAGYADVNFDDDIVGDEYDPDASYRIYHKLQINF